MQKIKEYICSGIGSNIYTGRFEMFNETVTGELRLLNSRISYKREQGFKGRVYVSIREFDDEFCMDSYTKFRVYTVPFRGIGRITFEKWG